MRKAVRRMIEAFVPRVEAWGGGWRVLYALFFISKSPFFSECATACAGGERAALAPVSDKRE